jgi:F0F1-type ATP synthase membrane subunit c/vacuolar-type H+-ATPase subunit K
MLLKNILVLLFAIAAGLTVSGIVANLYRIVARKPQTRPETLAYYAIMVVAGPSVLIENATRSFRTKDCSPLAYGFAVALTGYWSFALGLLVLTLWLSLKS